MNKKIGIMMGSDSDLPVMKSACQVLEKLDVEYELTVISAHRTPERAREYALKAEENGIGVIITAAGKAAHLPGVIAASTIVPVIGVPIRTSTLGGADSLYSMVQMPGGIPVATVALNGAKNAALLAVQMLATGDKEFREKLIQYRKEMQEDVNNAAAELEEKGYKKYLEEHF
ncbi:MAG TPA: 5-(carboxyamino)imidazole ribonucleotide mutase [Halanaerobiales bacterium]|nr:5-(carboxyamino)imidazole ribonucleotide mutase [Halanaerobiales bacterium]